MYETQVIFPRITKWSWRAPAFSVLYVAARRQYTQESQTPDKHSLPALPTHACTFFPLQKQTSRNLSIRCRMRSPVRLPASRMVSRSSRAICRSVYFRIECLSFTSSINAICYISLPYQNHFHAYINFPFITSLRSMHSSSSSTADLPRKSFRSYRSPQPDSLCTTLSVHTCCIFQTSRNPGIAPSDRSTRPQVCPQIHSQPYCSSLCDMPSHRRLKRSWYDSFHSCIHRRSCLTWHFPVCETVRFRIHRASTDDPFY